MGSNHPHHAGASRGTFFFAFDLYPSGSPLAWLVFFTAPGRCPPFFNPPACLFFCSELQHVVNSQRRVAKDPYRRCADGPQPFFQPVHRPIFHSIGTAYVSSEPLSYPPLSAPRVEFVSLAAFKIDAFHFFVRWNGNHGFSRVSPFPPHFEPTDLRSCSPHHLRASPGFFFFFWFERWTSFGTF